MGDVRYEAPYHAVRDAEDRTRLLARMSVKDLVSALAGASRGRDPLVANVLATTIHNRIAQMEGILDNLGECVLLLDANGDCLWANPAVTRILRWDPDEIKGKAVHALVHPRCRQHEACPLVVAPRTPGFIQQVDEDEFGTANHGRAPVAYTINSIVHDDESAGAALVVRDMAEHRRTAAALARLAALFDASTDAVYTKAASGLITSWNPGAERLYGYAASEIVGKPVSVLMPPGLEAELRLIMELVIQQGTPITFDSQRVRKDGALIDVSLSISPIRAGQRIEGALIVARDISTQRSEQALVARILDAAPQAMLAAAEDGRVILANARAHALFGYARGELVTRTVEDLVPARLRAAHTIHRSAYLSDPHERPMGAGMDLWGVRKDGSEFPVEISLSPVQGKGKDSVVTVASIRERPLPPDAPAPDP